MKVRLCEDMWEISFPYNPQLVQGVKELPGRRYNSINRTWSVPVEAAELLQCWTDSMELFFGELQEYIEDRKVKSATPLSKCYESKCYEYQKKGIQHLVKRDCRGLLADEMGLGKTVQAIGAVETAQMFPALVICPARLKTNWAREIEKWTGGGSVVLEGTKGDEISKAKWIIVNYDIISPNYRKTSLKDGKYRCICGELNSSLNCICGRNWEIIPKSKNMFVRTMTSNGWMKSISEVNPKVVVIDESHKIKNQKAERTKAVQTLARGRRVIALSGTPITNRPVEFFTALNLIDRVQYSSWWKFVQRYCGAKKTHFGWDFSGSSNTKELHENLTKTGVMLRRKKDEVLEELPPKQRIVFPIDGDRREYDRAKRDFIGWLATVNPESLDKAAKAEMLVKTEKLKQLAVETKLPSFLDWLDDFLETEEKAVLFFTHRKYMDIVQQKYENISVRTNNVSNTQKQSMIDKFQKDSKIRLFLGSVQADGVGITLTAARTVIFLELPWTPAECDQAEDRVHRIGQENRVQIYYPVLSGSIEEDIAMLLDDKREVLNSILDGRDSNENEQLLIQLIKTIKRNERCI